MRAAPLLLLAVALPAVAGKPDLGTDAQRANGAKVFPVSVEEMPVSVVALDGHGDHLMAKIDR